MNYSDLHALHFEPGEYVNELKVTEVLRLLETGNECPENELASKHHDVLQLFIRSPDEEQREVALACLKHFVRLGESTFPLLKKAGIVELLVTYHWGDTPQLCRALGELYVQAGVFKLDEPTRGVAPDSDMGPNRWGLSGKQPLAIAIEQDHVEFAQLLVESGASVENIGPVLQGGATRQALEYAREIGKPRVAAYLTGVMMARRLETTDEHISSASGAGRRRRVAL